MHLVIDNVLGLCCTSFGYQYSEIVESLSNIYFCVGDCVEDVISHLMPHLSLDPTLRTYSAICGFFNDNDYSDLNDLNNRINQHELRALKCS